MATATLLPPARAASLRRILVALAAAAGIAAGLYVLSSQAAADFLREGPARALGVKGDELRLLLGIGCIAATGVASAALWAGLSPARLALAGVALIVALGLVHILAAPAATLLALAAAAQGGARLTRARLTEVGPRHYPLRWGAGGLVALVGLVAVGAATVYLARPLFDEGTRLEETLAFDVAGLVQPTIDAGGGGEVGASPAAGGGTDSAEITSTPTAGDGGSVAQGALISMGPLEGTDAFHTASGEVLLVRSPEGDVVLRFQDYEVRNGPGLYVYLTPDPGGDVHADGAVELSALRATSGFVNYELPPDLDAASFRAAVIYCKPFSVTFAIAELQ